MSVLSSLSVCVVATRVERVAAVTRPTKLLAASFAEWLATKRQSGRFSIFHEFRLLTGLCKSTPGSRGEQVQKERSSRGKTCAISFWMCAVNTDITFTCNGQLRHPSSVKCRH